MECGVDAAAESPEDDGTLPSVSEYGTDTYGGRVNGQARLVHAQVVAAVVTLCNIGGRQDCPLEEAGGVNSLVLSPTVKRPILSLDTF